MALGAQLAANGHSRPDTPRLIEPHNAFSYGTSSDVWRHPATLRIRLTVKQVHRELVLDFADPGGIGGTTTTTTGSCLPR